MNKSITHFTSYSGFWILVAATVGVACGLGNTTLINNLAEAVGTLFIRLLKLVSTPIIFFSVLSTLCGMGNLSQAGRLGGRVIHYTLLTTLIAATVALGLYMVIDPSGHIHGQTALVPGQNDGPHIGYWQYVLTIVPTSFLAPFLEEQVISVLFLALILSVAILAIAEERRQRLQRLFDDIFAAIMALTSGILKLMPFAVWAFVTTFTVSLEQNAIGHQLMLYFACIVLANAVQALVVLPLLLTIKGLSPWRTFRGMLPALTVAFFAKSSSAALPVAMDAARNNLGIRTRIAGFSFPLCTTINMNACAGFILITVLFVAMLNGMHFSPAELLAWIAISTMAAIGNAGVPMGCFLLASTLLVTLNVPTELMGVILPVYALIDMLESAINVWSDACVTSIVNQECTDDDESAVMSLKTRS